MTEQATNERPHGVNGAAPVLIERACSVGMGRGQDAVLCDEPLNAAKLCLRGWHDAAAFTAVGFANDSDYTTTASNSLALQIATYYVAHP